MSGISRRSKTRVFLAVGTVLAGVAGAGLISSTAIASEADAEDGRRSVIAAALDPDAAGDIAAAVADRALQGASAFAAGASPEPPEPVHCPVPDSEFVDSWGFARSGGRSHKGVDMMAAHGAPVIAPVAGTIRASNSALGGIGFYLDDEDGNEYFGSHLASLDVVGWVEAGTQIGTVGSTGNAGTPHLHFEIAPAGGVSVNPYPFAQAWCADTAADPWAEMPRP